MIYMLEILGLIAIAASLAASPILINVLDRFFPPLGDDGGNAGYGSSTATSERAEMRNELRRATNIIESR